MGVKYFCEYRTLNTNELWNIEIDIPEYDGMPIEKQAAAGQACIIEHNGGDTLFDKFVIPSKASITLLFNNEEEVEELSLLEDKTALVQIFRNGGVDLFWQGYLVSDGIQYPDSGVDYPITLTATDMLEAAKDMPFVNTPCDPITIDGVVGSPNSPLNWIRKSILYSENLYNMMPIRWSCSLKNLQYPTDDFFAGRTGFIPNYEIFASSRQDTTVGWMLENIAKSVGCIFFQHGGYWYLVSLVDLANNSVLDFYEIDGNDLAPKTATLASVNLLTSLPLKINESTFSMVQKPISKVKSTYNHSMPTNIIPNGGFDTVENGMPIYLSCTPLVVISSEQPINNRVSGYSLRANNNASDEGYIKFSYDGMINDALPIDANLLFKTMQWGFIFMPKNFPSNIDGFIQWDSNPLEVEISYTGYQNNRFLNFFLNEFGFWYGRNPDGGGELTIDEVYINSAQDRATVVLTGEALSGQSYRLDWTQREENRSTFYWSNIVNFATDMSLEAATLKIAAETFGEADLDDISEGISRIIYRSEEYALYSSLTAVIGTPPTLRPRISFSVEGLKNNDVASIQFQSKGNQGNVLFPNPGVLNQMRALESGKLELKIFVKGDQDILFDDVYMNVSDNKEYWEISDGCADGKAEYELDISSSFSGFMTSSYMDNFAKSDLSMIMTNGVDTGTLTEIFGKTALRFLSKPTKKIDTEVQGVSQMFKVYEYKGKKYIPLKITANTETNSTKMTIFELNYDEELEITSQHKSSENGK